MSRWLTAVLFSMAGVAVLFAFLSLVNREQPLPAEPASVDVHPLPLTLDARQERCGPWLADTERLIENGRRCDVDSDCEVVDLRCPFGCWQAVNRNESETIQQAVIAYHESCDRCLYTCMALPQGKPVCLDKQCSYQQKHSPYVAPDAPG